MMEVDMKKIILSAAMAAFASLCSFGDTIDTASTVTISNRVLMVDEDGNLNVSNVLATVAQMTTNETMLVLAQASAEAAEKAAYEGTNIVQGVVSEIMAQQLVIYRRGFNDSFGTITVFSPSDDVVVTDIEVPEVVSDEGLKAVDITYAATLDVGALAPGFLYSSTLTNKADMAELASSNIDPPEQVSAESITMNGNVYAYSYKVRIWVPQEDQGFFVIYMDADEPDGDGSAVNIYGGQKGGFTGSTVWGSNQMTFVGGFLMSVTSTNTVTETTTE